MQWNHPEKTLSSKVNSNINPGTKRGLWAAIAQIFDPMVFVHSICYPAENCFKKFLPQLKSGIAQYLQTLGDGIPVNEF